MTTVRADIKEAKNVLKTLMQEGLVTASAGMIDQIIAARKSLTDSKRFDATKGLVFTGSVTYKQDLLEALAIIAGDALARARKEVPAKKNIHLAEMDEEAIKLGEWEKLPPDLRARIQRQMQQLIDAQEADLQKVLAFQYTHSVDSTGDLAVLKKDLADSADDYIDGPAIEAGASVTAAQITNEARAAFFFDDEVLKELDAFQFVNGDPVTEICQELAGKIFAKDDPDLDRYTPPLHWNCKSFIVPILAGDLGNREITPVELTKAAQKSIQFNDDSNCDGSLKLDYVEHPRQGSLQTIVISKDKAKSLEEAKNIAKKFGATNLEVDETDSSYRFRQRNPTDFVDGSFRTKPIETAGVSLVYGKLK